MGNRSTIMLQRNEIEEIQKETGCKFRPRIWSSVNLWLCKKTQSAVCVPLPEFSYSKSDCPIIQPLYQLGQVKYGNSQVRNDIPMYRAHYTVYSTRTVVFLSSNESLLCSIKLYLQNIFCCSRADFLRIPELAINPLGDRIVHSFFRDW